MLEVPPAPVVAWRNGGTPLGTKGETRATDSACRCRKLFLAALVSPPLAREHAPFRERSDAEPPPRKGTTGDATSMLGCQASRFCLRKNFSKIFRELKKVYFCMSILRIRRPAINSFIHLGWSFVFLKISDRCSPSLIQTSSTHFPSSIFPFILDFM